MSASEELLFGGRPRYDTGWAQHETAFMDLSPAGMAREPPALVGCTIRPAWRPTGGP